MAASISIRDKQCIVCSTSESRMHLGSSTKCHSSDFLDKLNLMLGEELHLPAHFMNNVHVCDRCLKYTVNHHSKLITLKQNVSTLLKQTEDAPADDPTLVSVEHGNVGYSETARANKRKLEETNDDLECRKKAPHHEDHHYSKSSANLYEDSCEINQEAERLVRTVSIDNFLVVTKQLDSITSKNSVLCPGHSRCLLDTGLFSKAVIEFSRCCPSLFQTLAVAVSKMKNTTEKVAILATIYGMILHSRNNKLSAIQQLYSTVVLACNADNRLLTKLNTIQLTLTEHSKRNIIQRFGQEADERIQKEIFKGLDGKFNGDNLDFRVHTNDIRMKSKDRDYHFFATDFVTDRVSLDGLSRTAPKPEDVNVTVQDFVPNENEYTHFKETLKVLIARLVKDFEGFKWLRSILPLHIPHQYSDEMSQKSNVFVLPVSLNNEAAYQDCVHIMDEYEQYLNKWYTKAGRGEELHNLNVPVGGDQLTRVRLQGAKSLRAGAHTKSERFDHLEPIVIEMFHTLQDFLEKLCKRFLNFKNSKDQGTLPNLKILIQRDNVNGNVKSRYKAHEDFITTCGEAYIQSFVMWKFKMTSMNDIPEHPAIPHNIENFKNGPKLEVFHKVMDEVVAELFMPFNIQESASLDVTITTGGQQTMIQIQDSDSILLNMIVNDQRLMIKTTRAALSTRAGVTVHAAGRDINVKATKKDTSNLKTYVTDFLQWFFIVMQFKDVVKEGDMKRMNIVLKHMVPFLYSHSQLSKYMVECIDFILKTEHTLSPYMALKVRASSFVNTKGKPGKNKAADMQKEHEVKFLKSVIKSLGSNKTETSIVNTTKAAPVMLEIAANFETMTGEKVIKTNHKQKSRASDISIITDKLKCLKLWEHCQTNHNMKVGQTPFDFDRKQFCSSIQSKIDLLRMDVPIVEEDEGNE